MSKGAPCLKPVGAGRNDRADVVKYKPLAKLHRVIMNILILFLQTPYKSETKSKQVISIKSPEFLNLQSFLLYPIPLSSPLFFIFTYCMLSTEFFAQVYVCVPHALLVCTEVRRGN